MIWRREERTVYVSSRIITSSPQSNSDFEFGFKTREQGLDMILGTLDLDLSLTAKKIERFLPLPSHCPVLTTERVSILYFISRYQF